MAFSDETSYTGQQNISTFNGNILIDNARGEISVRRTGGFDKVTVINQDGFLTTDGVTSTKVNPPGIIQNDGVNDRILLGDDTKL